MAVTAEVVTWSTAVELDGVPAEKIDIGARGAFVAVNRDGLGAMYEEIEILAITDIELNSADMLNSVMFLRSRKMLPRNLVSSGSLVSFSTQYISHSALSEADVLGVVEAYNLKLIDFYADPLTAALWVNESVACGSVTIEQSTTVVFGQPTVNFSSVRVAKEEPSSTSPSTAPSATNVAHDASSDESTDVIAFILPVVICTLLFAFFIVWYTKRRHAKHAGSTVELTTTPNHMHAGHEEDSDREEGQSQQHKYDDGVDSEFDSHPMQKKSKFNTAVRSSSLLSKVKSNKDKVMRKRGNRYAKI